MAGASKMGGSRDGSTVLPEDLVVWEILIRLPAKALLRCRAVCRSWRRLTSTDDILLAHHRHELSLSLVFFDKKVDNNLDATLDAFDLRQRPTERQPVLHSKTRWFEVHGSCDGLILLSSNRSVYLCNPSTRQWITLLILNSACVRGMYSHGPSGEYRILYRTRAEQPVWYVLTIGSSAEPRCIEQSFASPSVQQFVEAGLPYFQGPAIFLHNCLHWFSYWYGQQAIVVFHTVTESFRLMHLPTDAPRSRWSPDLLEIDGTLGISWGSENVIKLCVLQDYETGGWSLKYQIEYPVPEMSVRKDSLCVGRIVSEDGDALIQCSDSNKLFHLDRNGKLLQTLQWQDMVSWASEFRFKESLIKHAFFEGPRRSRCSKPPCFFDGL